MRSSFFFIAITLLMIPVSVFAVDFVELAPIPGLNLTTDTTISTYINQVFNLVIAVGAILAVIRIVMGGLQYMTKEAVAETKEARNTITMALVGLILLLGSWLILNIINPQITNLDGLTFTTIGDIDATEVGERRREQEERRREQEELRRAQQRQLLIFSWCTSFAPQNLFTERCASLGGTPTIERICLNVDPRDGSCRLCEPLRCIAEE